MALIGETSNWSKNTRFHEESQGLAGRPGFNPSERFLPQLRVNPLTAKNPR